MSRAVFDEASPEDHAAFLAVFPELDNPAPHRTPSAAAAAEARLLAFVLRDPRNLDHLPGLTPQHFGDDQYRAVFAHQLRARAAGCDGMDLLAVAAALPGVIELRDLVLIEQQADGMTPASAASLIPLVEQQAQRRQLLETGQALMALGMDPARSPVQGIEAAIRQLSEAAAPSAPSAPHLRPVSVADVLTNPAPPPSYVWDGYIPRGVVTLFGAHGGTGKSTIGLMLAVAAALGRPLFGVATEPCSTLFVSLEDGTDIIRHRLATICRAWDVSPYDLDGRLHIVDGTENPELFQAEARSAGETTPAYRELVALAESTQAGLVLVDNASDSFGGDEINRRQVRAFMRALGLIASRTHCAALLLAHVDKTTSRNSKPENGEGYSGSTAWHNSVRSRLFMTRDKSGLLKLEHQKNNLGRKRDELVIAWEEGAHLPELASEQDASALTARIMAKADDTAAAAILRLMAELEGLGQFCGTALSARNNPFAVLKSQPAYQALKLSRDDLQRIVTQCQRAGWIAAFDYRTPDRKDRQRWTVTAAGKTFSELSAPSAPSAPSYM